MRRTPEITRQGHWHIDYIRPLARARGVRAWEVATEEKRPHVEGCAWHSEDDGRWLRIDIESREGSMHFRDGQDGSMATEIALPIPPQRWWARWWRRHVRRHRYYEPMWTTVSSNDKWAVYVAAVRVA